MSSLIAYLIAIILSLAVTALLGFVIIPWLHKLKFGQTILEIGPKWHKKKQGTPNMGGLMFAAGIIVSFIIAAVIFHLTGGNLETDYSAIFKGRETVMLIAGLMLATGCGLVGFIDDYTKIKLKRNEGLTPKQKTVGQLIMATAYVLTLWLSKNYIWYFPFIGRVDFSKNAGLAVVFWILSIIIVYGTVNSVNLTDGIDGLCSSVTAVVAFSFIIISIFQNFSGLGIFASSIFGAMVGFLFWNWNPAKVFMGDTGSLFLGGLVASLGFTVKCPVLLLLFGIIYVIETLSDIIQISYFKLTHGKRIFKMAPIHHHFEMCGWSEKKICLIFSFVAAIGCTIGAILLILG